MPSLAPALRKKLEDAVKEARDVAEAGARAALEQLAVHTAEPFGHLSPDDRELRNRLRARGRQLGDAREAQTGAHQIDHLVVECAYEHWHRMLFARFLAENGVLMANSETLDIENTPVTLEECEELAPDEGAANGWELAGRYASRMLPQIFRPDAPVLAVHLPPERQRRLEQILSELAPETFNASDALGWVYQFWQAKKKDNVNASGVKIGADELPAVTQLFTEPYMVEFLLHNTLGAWWAGKVLAERPELTRTARSEDELREACALPRCSWTYLRFVEVDGEWRPAAGCFRDWPRTAAELRVVDPCCGSGHFLVAAHEILVQLRMKEESLDSRQAGDAVLRDNIFGLELDERCTQIAAFALALASWMVRGGGYRKLPVIHVACSGLAPRAKRNEWLALARDDVRLRNGMEQLFTRFQDAPFLGSLIDPLSVGMSGQQRELGVARFDELRPMLTRALSRTPAGSSLSDSQDERIELAVAASGIASAAEILSGSYHLVATNVPYLVRAKQIGQLAAFCEREYPLSKRDLATVFYERLLRMVTETGAVAVTITQYWLFLSKYKELRKRTIDGNTWRVVAKLGPNGFDTISGEAVNVGLLICSPSAATQGHRITGVDCVDAGNPSAKATALMERPVVSVPQESQRRNPDHWISLSVVDKRHLLSAYVTSYHGLSTTDYARFGRLFWEFPEIATPWVAQQSTVKPTCRFGGREHIVKWGDDGEELRDFSRSGAAVVITGREAWSRRGVAVSQMGDLQVTLYTGEAFDDNTAVLVPKRAEHLGAVWAFCSSPEYAATVREIDQSFKVTYPTLAKVPWDFERWSTIATEQPDPRSWKAVSSDPTQWVFAGAIDGVDPVLHVAVARMLGFRWPSQAPDPLDAHLDDDGVVCVPSVRGEQAASERVQAMLADALDSEWNAKNRDRLLTAVGAKGKGLTWWLQNKFFEQHCQLFQKRPFIWHIWDGIKKDGFGALVNYHMLDRKLLETLTYTYLGDWIRRQQDDAARNVDGASERLDAARRLQQSLELILEGEKPYDIFVRWKPLHEQPIGWEPDLDDGVRVNIRPFMTVPDVDRKGAGILRYKPNIHWKKDRGTDPDDAPWYDLGPSYGESKGARINDHHLSLAEKRAAREARGGRS